VGYPVSPGPCNKFWAAPVHHPVGPRTNASFPACPPGRSDRLRTRRERAVRARGASCLGPAVACFWRSRPERCGAGRDPSASVLRQVVDVQERLPAKVLGQSLQPGEKLPRARHVRQTWQDGLGLRRSEGQPRRVRRKRDQGLRSREQARIRTTDRQVPVSGRSVFSDGHRQAFGRVRLRARVGRRDEISWRLRARRHTQASYAGVLESPLLRGRSHPVDTRNAREIRRLQPCSPRPSK
jgi:hypothetical protein